jgi:hypothetical protein
MQEYRKSLHSASEIDKRVIYLKLSEGGVKSIVPVGEEPAMR